LKKSQQLSQGDDQQQQQQQQKIILLEVKGGDDPIALTVHGGMAVLLSFSLLVITAPAAARQPT
jgi:hypothetical protein